MKHVCKSCRGENTLDIVDVVREQRRIEPAAEGKAYRLVDPAPARVDSMTRFECRDCRRMGSNIDKVAEVVF